MNLLFRIKNKRDLKIKLNVKIALFKYTNKGTEMYKITKFLADKIGIK